LIVSTAAACQGGQAASPSPEIIIASNMPMSASPDRFAIWEQAVGYAISQQSSVDGYRIGYWPLDSSLGGDQSQLRGRENVKRMIADRRVLGMVGPVSSFVGKVEMPEANLADLAMVSPSTTNSCLTVTSPELNCSPSPGELRPAGSNNFFRIAPRDPLQGRAMGEYAATKLGRKRVAALNEVGREGTLYVKEFSTAMQKHGGEVVYQADISEDNSNFTDFLQQAKNRGADAVYAVGVQDPNQNLHACDAAAQMAVVMPGAYFLSMDGITFNRDCVQHLGGAPPNVYATLGAVDPGKSTDPNVRKTVEAFLKAHPFNFEATSYTVYTFAAYDCARILMEAIKRAIRSDGAKFPSRKQVVAALAQPPEFVGLTGSYSFDANGDALKPMMSIYKVDGGAWRFVQVYHLGAQ
jgi:branched-chain amino acid transport system substrate-binding protein